MKVATITPIHHLELARASNVHMVLAHLVFKYSIYVDFYHARALEGDFIILDNGVAETGQPMKLDMLMQAAEMVHAAELILPDELHYAEATVVYAENAFHNKEFMAWAKKEPWPGGTDPKAVRLMTVPHGANLAEWRLCAEALMALPIDTIGISKFEVDVDPRTTVEGRQSMARIVRDCETLPSKRVDIHFLGMHGNPLELRANPDAARSVDSALACIAAAHNVQFHPMWGLLHRPSDWHYDPDTVLTIEQMAMAAYNIGFIKNMAGPG